MEQKFIIQIYCCGTIIEYAVCGLQRLEAERAILAKFVGEELARDAATRDPGRDYYELTSEQFTDYSNQRVALGTQGK